MTAVALLVLVFGITSLLAALARWGMDIYLQSWHDREVAKLAGYSADRSSS